MHGKKICILVFLFFSNKWLGKELMYDKMKIRSAKKSERYKFETSPAIAAMIKRSCYPADAGARMIGINLKE